jgi:Adenylate and Guanylate cyclase catalytic domain
LHPVWVFSRLKPSETAVSKQLTQLNHLLTLLADNMLPFTDVAVAGLPEPNKKHALIMGRFAYECMIKTHELVKELEATLGPGTSDLTIRVGLHSGSVTAGVLRGEKARFQLFGDAMNTASRMESTGKRGSIQLSQDTADYFIAADKSHWIKPREGLVSVKGKGELQTYWLIPSTLSSSEKNAESDHSKTNQVPSGRTQMLLKHAHESIRQLEKWGHLNLEDSTIDAHKKARLINWNVEILVQLLSKVVASRIGCVSHNGTDVSMGDSSTHDGVSRGTMVIDEVTEIITLPTFNKSNSKSLVGAVPLSDDVRAQLHSYVTALANFYHDVPFHNMEHASHVTLSANKLMKRIIATASNFTDDMKLYPGRKSKSAKPMGSRSSEDIYQEFHEKTKNVHDNTFGISSDPLTQFSIV